MNKLIEKAEREIKEFVLPKLPIKKFIIKKMYKDNNYLGFYKSGSVYKIPIIKLNITCIKQSAKDICNLDISLYDIILSTILHELAHALQDLKDLPPLEEEAEVFAYEYTIFGKVLKI